MYFVSKREKDGSVLLVNTNGDFKRFSPNELIRYIKEKEIEVTGVKVCDDDSYEINILIPIKFSLVNTISGQFDIDLEETSNLDAARNPVPVQSQHNSAQSTQQPEEPKAPRTALQAYVPPVPTKGQEITNNLAQENAGKEQEVRLQKQPLPEAKKDASTPMEQSDSWQRDENGWSFSFL